MSEKKGAATVFRLLAYRQGGQGEILYGFLQLQPSVQNLP
jgi:hypothetical protein